MIEDKPLEGSTDAPNKEKVGSKDCEFAEENGSKMFSLFVTPMSKMLLELSEDSKVSSQLVGKAA